MHVIIQAGSQDYAHRIAIMAERHDLNIFVPKDFFGNEFLELGPRADHSGPALVLLKNCSAQRLAIIDLIESTFLKRYVTRIYFCEELVEDYQNLDIVQKCKDLLCPFLDPKNRESLSEEETLTFNLSNTEENEIPRENWGKGKYGRTVEGEKLPKILKPSKSPRTAVSQERGFEYGGDQRLSFISGDEIKLRLQCFPRTLEKLVVEKIQFVEFNPTKFTHTLDVVHCEEGTFFGLNPANETWLNSSLRMGSTNGKACKAVCKLEEALTVCGIQLSPEMTGVDVGAAPGAWTEFLSPKIKKVIAIDPAELDPKVVSLPNVIHIKKKVEDALVDLLEAHNLSQCEIIVCDMNRHPLQAVEMLKPLWPFLAPGGILVMTMKFRGRGREKDSLILEEVEKSFKPKISHSRFVWLMANSVYERTFIATK